MKLLSSLLVAMAALGGPAQALQQSAADAARVVKDCGTCHGEQRVAFERDVHAAFGLDCTTCHGGVGGSLDADTAHGDALSPLSSPAAIVASCGDCHADQERMRVSGLRTDQLSLYRASAHGKLLAEGDEHVVATCVSCHGSHGVFRHTDSRSPIFKRNQVETCGSCHSDPELMAPYGLGTHVAEEYRSSVHGRSLLFDEHIAAPACTDCHGTHGAHPPGSAEIELVCGNCHSIVQEHYERSAHFVGAASNGAVQCASCHLNHGVESPTSSMLIGDEERHCGACHEEDPGYQAGLELYNQVTSFAAAIEEVEEVIRDAASRGLYMEEEHGYVGEAQALLVRARAMTHATSPLLLVDVLSRGDAMLDRTLESLEIKQRGSRDVRIFTALFFAVTLAFAIVMLMYARMLRGLPRGYRSKQGQGVRGGR